MPDTVCIGCSAVKKSARSDVRRRFFSRIVTSKGNIGRCSANIFVTFLNMFLDGLKNTWETHEYALVRLKMAQSGTDTSTALLYWAEAHTCQRA